MPVHEHEHVRVHERSNICNGMHMFVMRASFSEGSFQADKDSTMNKNKRISSSLKKMMKPFFLKCHPDVQTSDITREVNLEALQTLNGFMDTLDATCDGKRVDWPRLLPIEFLLKTEEITARRRKPAEVITRRKVELLVPSKTIRDAILSSTGSERQDSIHRLHVEVQKEFSKILHVAGLPAPNAVFEEDHVQNDTWGGFTDHEIPDKAGPGYTYGPRFTTDEQPRSRYEESRDRFVRSIDPVKLDKLYQEAIKDMEADILTQGAIKDHSVLRQEMVNNIIARVRIDRDADIGGLDQLITLRRLSLILADNFDKLFMEDFGRMWEELTIILTNPRDFGTSESALYRRRKRGQESGFQFTYCADNHVTIHVPIDFRDEELLQELDRNLWDWFDMVDESLEDMLRS